MRLKNINEIEPKYFALEKDDIAPPTPASEGSWFNPFNWPSKVGTAVVGGATKVASGIQVKPEVKIDLLKPVIALGVIFIAYKIFTRKKK